MSFYLFIAISFYLNIVCKNIVCELGLTVQKLLQGEFYFTDCSSHGWNFQRQICLSSRQKKQPGCSQPVQNCLKVPVSLFPHFVVSDPITVNEIQIFVQLIFVRILWANCHWSKWLYFMFLLKYARRGGVWKPIAICII